MDEGHKKTKMETRKRNQKGKPEKRPEKVEEDVNKKHENKICVSNKWKRQMESQQEKPQLKLKSLWRLKGH